MAKTLTHPFIPIARPLRHEDIVGFLGQSIAVENNGLRGRVYMPGRVGKSVRITGIFSKQDKIVIFGSYDDTPRQGILCSIPIEILNTSASMASFALTPRRRRHHPLVRPHAARDSYVSQESFRVK